MVWCDRAARSLGVRPGVTVAAARARASALVTVEEDRAALAEARREVVRRILTVSPRIAFDGVLRAWVEPVCRSSGALPTWCGEVHRSLADLCTATIGVAPTATVAWAAACAADDDGHLIVTEAEARRFLDDQPIEVLEVRGEALDVLAALGVRRVGALRAFDPVSLGMRFGPAVAEARRRIDGSDPRRPATPRAWDDESIRVHLDDELDALAPLAFLLAPACDRLTADLRGRGLGAVCLRLVLELRGGTERVVEVRTASPMADGRTALELLRTELERVRLSSPLTAFRLEAAVTAPLRPDGADLFAGAGRDPAAREIALHRLRTRFGDGSVARASRVETGAVLQRARWVHSNTATAAARRAGAAAEMSPWRRVEPPVPLQRSFADVAGRCRRLVRMGRVERTTAPWWEDGRRRVELVAWAEMEGPLLVLLRALCDSGCDDVWEVVAWMD